MVFWKSKHFDVRKERKINLKGCEIFVHIFAITLCIDHGHNGDIFSSLILKDLDSISNFQWTIKFQKVIQ